MEKLLQQPDKLNVEQPLTLKILLACGAAGPLFFIIMFLIEGVTRADYSPLRQPVSSLAIGDWGWMQVINFLITGSLLIAYAVGLRQSLRPAGRLFWAPFLIGLVGIGLIGAGFFVTDPLNGYPPGSPLIPTVRTTPGKLHDLFSLPVFTALPAACFVFARRFWKSGQSGWSVYSILAGIGMLVFFVLAGKGFQQAPGYAEVAGVYQRLSIGIGFTWIASSAIHLLRVKTQDFRK